MDEENTALVLIVDHQNWGAFAGYLMSHFVSFYVEQQIFGNDNHLVCFYVRGDWQITPLFKKYAPCTFGYHRAAVPELDQ